MGSLDIERLESFSSALAGGSVQANLAGRGVEVHDLGEERADLPRLIMGYSAEDARDTDFDSTTSSGS